MAPKIDGVKEHRSDAAVRSTDEMRIPNTPLRQPIRRGSTAVRINAAQELAEDLRTAVQRARDAGLPVVAFCLEQAKRQTEQAIEDAEKNG